MAKLPVTNVKVDVLTNQQVFEVNGATGPLYGVSVSEDQVKSMIMRGYEVVYEGETVKNYGHLVKMVRESLKDSSKEAEKAKEEEAKKKEAKKKAKAKEEKKAKEKEAKKKEAEKKETNKPKKGKAANKKPKRKTKK